MALADWLRKRRRISRDASREEGRQKLLEFLRETYLDEVKDIANFTRHAEGMYYPHFRERLLRLVEEERRVRVTLQERRSHRPVDFTFHRATHDARLVFAGREDRDLARR